MLLISGWPLLIFEPLFTMQLRNYQKEIAAKAQAILKRHKIVLLAAEVRTGKTLMALETARLYGAQHVLFLTKKMAMSSISWDYNTFWYASHFQLTVINNESVHKIPSEWYDLVIVDEVHRLSGFPKPSKQAKDIRARFHECPMILLSGTPAPESYAQMYHEFWISDASPWSHKKYKSFYRWADEYVNKRQIRTSYWFATDYSDADMGKVLGTMKHLMLTHTQEQSGFSTSVTEDVLHVRMKPSTYALAEKLTKDLVVQWKTELIMADTWVKLMMKLHQIYSGTVKFESWNSMTLDDSKAQFIKERFAGMRIGVYYNFKEELTMLKSVFGSELTESIEQFDSGSHRIIALQIVSGREWISLRHAEHIVFMNIQFSCTSYLQARDRMTTMERKENKIYWIFSEGGIEDKIYKTVLKKQDYTLRIFNRDFSL